MDSVALMLRAGLRLRLGRPAAALEDALAAEAGIGQDLAGRAVVLQVSSVMSVYLPLGVRQLQARATLALGRPERALLLYQRAGRLPGGRGAGAGAARCLDAIHAALGSGGGRLPAPPRNSPFQSDLQYLQV